jgi:uncharacterized protein YndB with AHSA1/START domain
MALRGARERNGSEVRASEEELNYTGQDFTLWKVENQQELRAPMATTQITPERDAVITEIFIAAPPERVFQALVDREQALRWGSKAEFVMTKWEMDARVGGKWVFVSKEQNPTGRYANIDLVHHGEILQFDPPRLLEYTWFASWHPDPLRRTVVRWELSSVPGGTQLKVTHNGLAPMPEACQGYAQGWPGLVTRIKQFIETEK